MSTKLNADELARKRFPYAIPGVMDDMVRLRQINTYAAAIREVAQPIADERDELRQALKQLLMACADGSNASMYIGTSNARAILAKYPKP
jgi:hypothetical protein